MLAIEFGREDLYPFCRKVPFKLIALNDHIDFERLKTKGTLTNHEVYRADIVYFVDDDGSTKVLRQVEKKYKKTSP